MCFFFFNDTATTEIYTLSLHDALPISVQGVKGGDAGDLGELPLRLGLLLRQTLRLLLLFRQLCPQTSNLTVLLLDSLISCPDRLVLQPKIPKQLCAPLHFRPQRLRQRHPIFPLSAFIVLVIALEVGLEPVNRLSQVALLGVLVFVVLLSLVFLSLLIMWILILLSLFGGWLAGWVGGLTGREDGDDGIGGRADVAGAHEPSKALAARAVVRRIGIGRAGLGHPSLVILPNSSAQHSAAGSRHAAAACSLGERLGRGKRGKEGGEEGKEKGGGGKRREGGEKKERKKEGKKKKGKEGEKEGKGKEGERKGGKGGGKKGEREKKKKREGEGRKERKTIVSLLN